MTTPLLPTIHGPDDLRRLKEKDLDRLAIEIRKLIVQTVSRNGGHLASNLGVVELTIALHRVFRTPRDVIIWDVGHQCYTHKILTGRAEQFATLRKHGGLSGFPRRAESPHDFIETGHASTAISCALGVVTARQMRGESGKVVAVVGDGALTGGLAFAGLNNAGQSKKNLIIILNDNAMSIGRNVGAFSAYLGRLTMTRAYEAFRRRFDTTIVRLPFGSELKVGVDRLKKVFKAMLFRQTIFSDLGFRYVGPVDGHNVHSLARILCNVRDVQGPVVVHVITRKGKGYALAENNPTRFHGITPFSLVDGSVEESTRLTFSEAFSRIMVQLAEENPAIVGITAAMVDGTGLKALASAHPSRVFDVGIAEDHAVTFAAGLALAGMRPVVALYSTFLQRAVDQVIHDVALPGLPVVFAVDRAGFVPGDGETHQGIFDISLFSSVPGLTMIAPASRGELAVCLRWAVCAGRPVMLRYPKSVCGPELPELTGPVEVGRGAFVRFLHSEALLLSVGGLLPQCLEGAHLLNLEGISVDIYNLRFVKPLDEEHLLSLLRLYRFVVLVEEAATRGGVGEQVSRLLAERLPGSVCFVAMGAPDRFPGLGTREQLLAAAGLNGEAIAAAVRRACETTFTRESRRPLIASFRGARAP